VLAPGEDKDMDWHLPQSKKLQQLTAKEDEKKKNPKPNG
jgi:hypothetical protein